MKLPFFSVAAGLTIFSVVGALAADATSSNNASFSAQIEEIDRSFEPQTSRIGEITRVLNLEPAFEKLASSGNDIVDESLAYLSEPGHTPLQRRIAILATHKVSVSDWVRFSNKILDMYENHQADIWEVEDTIFPRRFYLNYAEDYFWPLDIRRLLWRAYHLNNLRSNVHGMIIGDLTGLAKLLNWLFGSGPY